MNNDLNLDKTRICFDTDDLDHDRETCHKCNLDQPTTQCNYCNKYKPQEEVERMDDGTDRCGECAVKGVHVCAGANHDDLRCDRVAYGNDEYCPYCREYLYNRSLEQAHGSNLHPLFRDIMNPFINPKKSA